MANYSPATQNRCVLALTPEVYAAGTDTGTGFSIRGFESATVIVNMGAMVGGSTVDITVETATSFGGAYAPISGAVFAFDQGVTDHSDTIHVGFVDLKGHDGFMLVEGVTASAASTYGITVILHAPGLPSGLGRAIGSEANQTLAPTFSV